MGSIRTPPPSTTWSGAGSCHACEGRGVVQNPLWAEFFSAHRIPADDLAARFFQERGESKPPPEEILCPACDGAGEISKMNAQGFREKGDTDKGGFLFPSPRSQKGGGDETCDGSAASSSRVGRCRSRLRHRCPRCHFVFSDPLPLADYQPAPAGPRSASTAGAPANALTSSNACPICQGTGIDPYPPVWAADDTCLLCEGTGTL